MRRTRIILTTVTHPLALSKPYAHHPHDSYASFCSFHYFDWLALVGVSRMILEDPLQDDPLRHPGGESLLDAIRQRKSWLLLVHERQKWPETPIIPRYWSDWNVFVLSNSVANHQTRVERFLVSFLQE